MRKSDFAISAGGTTLYELCACKVPAVCFSFADNQAGFTKEMGKQGIMCDAGDAREQGNVCGAGDARKQGSVCDDAGDVRKQSGVCDTEDTREQDSFIKKIYKQLMKLWNDEQLCGRYREEMGQLVDGKGVERIVEKIQAM